MGFVNSFFDADPAWGTLLDNLHVDAAHQRRRLGSRLLTATAGAVARRPGPRGLYLWVLEQNTAARAFCEAHGGMVAGAEPVAPPGGVAGRLDGAPSKLPVHWADAAACAWRPSATRGPPAF